MSKFNTCEKTHQDIDGFIAAVAEASDASQEPDEPRPAVFSVHSPALVPIAGRLAINLQNVQFGRGEI